jgi:hypothetical protein
MKGYKIFEMGRFNLSFAWYDFWVGAYIDRSNKKIYICLVPMILITIQL